MDNAKQIVQTMYKRDYFSQWLGIEIVAAEEGRCTLRMRVRAEMLNGFGIAHGGITYSLADSALAFACNSFGRHAVSVETSISHTASVKEGDILTASALLETQSNRIGVFRIEVVREADNKVVGIFKGVVYRKDTLWEVDM